MNEILKKILYYIAAIYFIISIVGGAILSSRLERTRQELEYYRNEFNAATDRQSELAEILRRDGEILRESSTTISGIRSQIAAIRESYEAMQSIIDNDNSSSNK